MTDRKNIKIDEELFARLKEDKGRHRSWPQYFEDQLAEDDTPDALDVDAVADAVAERIDADGGATDIDGVVADLKAELPGAVADEVEGRLR